ncbi:MAG TPA: histidinol dehydrogenase [Acidimicrobiales bacterium]|nr:histidinol dehydrogenase [Acidimicrobiales bacterium]
MLSLLDLRGFTGDLRAALPRPSVASDVPLAAVREILADVKQRGDDALRELTQRFDGVELDTIRVPTADLQRARDSIPASLREALDRAAEGIADFHASERATEASYERDGILVRTRPVPVDRAGCYVPGGRAVYPSTVLMTAIPARVAGVPQVVLCVPPDRATGAVPQATLAAAAIAEVDEVYAVGGAQAIAAMAYGTDSIAPVDVIVGPGNIYVAIAKRELAGEGLVGIPSAFAGPSEVVVVADETTPVDSAAIDVIVQAEHGPHGLAWLITWSEAVAEAVNAAIDRLVARAPRRDDIEATLAEGGYAVLVDGPEEAIAVANAIAPEHLELMCSDPDALVSLVRHAGAVFCGPWAPASVGDYIAGPSHVLPTFGSARFGQALTVADFTKLVHVVTLDEAALGKVAPHVAALAEAEGLAAHAASVRIRMTEEPR